MFKELDAGVDEILAKMSLDEKIGQLNQICYSYQPDTILKIKDMIRKGQVGSLILADSSTAGNDASAAVNADLLDEFQKVAVNESPNKIPLIFGRDVIYGHKTVYPIPLAQACSFNPELIERCYSQIAEEAAAEGIHWTFTPMLDMCRDPRWGRIIESSGEDPYLASKIAGAVVVGCQGTDLGDKKLVACAKHFIGYGAAEGGRDYHHAEISNYSLYNYYLPAFKSAIESGVGTVMSSFNDINGENVGSSKFYMTDILRDYLGFEGFVVSDWGGVQLPKLQGTAQNDAQCAEMCINAGTDMDMVVQAYFNNLKSLIESGKVSEETLNLSVRRILRVKLAKNLFEKPYSSNIEYSKIEHLENAKKLAAESMVLLKNNGVLPLTKEEKVILVGSMAEEKRSLLGSWTLDGRVEETSSLFEVLNTTLGPENVLYSLDCKANTVIVVLGESNQMNGEARCLSDISVSKEQKELIINAKQTGKKVVGIMLYGRPVALEDVEEYFDAILYAWHSGTKTADAVTDILFGEISPSGRLSVSFPRKSGHIPVYYNALKPGKSVNAYYNEVWEGQRTACYIDGMATPMYPFGYGLSYASFKYSEISAEKSKMSLQSVLDGDKFKLSVSVSNVGDFSAKETVQLYIRDKIATVMRPIRELKGFVKKEIKAGETQRFDFELGYNELGYYLPNGEYTLEKGEFDVFIGDNCLTNNKTTVEIV